MNIVAMGLLASTLAGLATGVGAAPAFFFRNVSDRVLNTMLGGAAGVMLAATSFSLIIPGIEAGDVLWPGYGVYVMVAGMLLGALFLDRMDHWLPHEHFVLGPEGPSSKLRKIWLFIIAITIHNFPEGLAVGVGYGGGDVGAGTSLAIGIGLQNMPEGLAVALPLLGLGYPRASLRSGFCRRRHVVRDQRRNHPRNPQQRQIPPGHLRGHGGVRHHDVTG
jgi:ZIP family zinc transporter